MSKEALGTCYQDALNYLIMHRNKGVRLVHGLVTGQGPIAGLIYGHAWIEDGDMVIDPSHSPHIIMPRAVYYALGHIEVTFKYNGAEAYEKMNEWGTYGPWEKEFWAEGVSG